MARCHIRYCCCRAIRYASDAMPAPPRHVERRYFGKGLAFSAIIVSSVSWRSAMPSSLCVCAMRQTYAQQRSALRGERVFLLRRRAAQQMHIVSLLRFEFCDSERCAIYAAILQHYASAAAFVTQMITPPSFASFSRRAVCGEGIWRYAPLYAH